MSDMKSESSKGHKIYSVWKALYFSHNACVSVNQIISENTLFSLLQYTFPHHRMLYIGDVDDKL